MEDKSIVPVNQIAVRSSTGYEFSNSNPAKVVEIEDDPVEVVEKQMEDLKLDHQFNEKDVPKVFQDLMKQKKNNLKEIFFHIHEQDCTMTFDEIEVLLEKKGNDWMINYKNTDKTIKADDPEKSIINHFWFVLKNPNIKLNFLGIYICEDDCWKNNTKTNNSQKIDKEKLNTRLQSMTDSINHPIKTDILGMEGFNEDTFLSVLKHTKPGTLELIDFGISWKNEGNYQKMKEIVETDNWKQANRIFSTAVTPLKIEDLFQYEVVWLEINITPEVVLGVAKHAFNSASLKCCTLSSLKQNLNIDPIMNFIKSEIKGSIITKIKPIRPQDEFCFKIVKFEKPVFLSGHEHHITIQNY